MDARGTRLLGNETALFQDTALGIPKPFDISQGFGVGVSGLASRAAEQKRREARQTTTEPQNPKPEALIRV
jgi:hypothetical protein